MNAKLKLPGVIFGMMFLLMSLSYAQVDVTFTVTDGTWLYENIKIKGSMTDWALVQAYDDGTNGDVTAGDHVWTAVVSSVADGDYEWGAIEDDGSEWGIWLIDGPNLQFSVSGGVVTGETSYEIPPFTTATAGAITFTIDDGTAGYQDIELKGTMTDWALVQMYDDGTNGDETAGDHIWTCVVDSITAGDHEWGAIENDGSEWGIWLIDGPNRMFTLDDDLTTYHGQTSYTIPAPSVKFPVTFTVIDSGNGYQDVEIKGQMTGWATHDMTPTDTTDTDLVHWTYTDSVEAGSYEWGAIENDGSQWGIWLPSLAGFEANPEFTMGATGTVTGDTLIAIPYQGTTVTKVLMFSVDMTEWLDEEGATGIPLFSVARNDTMFVRGDFNGWGTDLMERSPGTNIFSAAVTQTAPDIQTQNYKFFIQHSAESQALLEAEYGAFYDDMGWEDSPQFGGGNRSYTLGDTTADVYVRPTEGYYDLPPGAVVPEGESVMLTFTVDMATAANDGFVEGTDDVYLILKDKWLNYFQGFGWGTSGGSRHTATPNGDGTYSASVTVTGPVPWHIVYVWEFSNADLGDVQEGGGFGIGRFRARYFHQDIDNSCAWVPSYAFPTDTWQKDPPLYVETYDSDNICTTILSVSEIDGVTPNEFSLSDNYPNPFNPSTTIQFTIPIGDEVTLSIYNILGEKVATLHNSYAKPGTYAATWNGRDTNGNLMPSGVYFYELNAGVHFRQVKKMMLIK